MKTMKTLNGTVQTNTVLYLSVENVDVYIFEQCIHYTKIEQFETLRKEIESNDIINLASQRYQLATLEKLLLKFKQLNNL